MNQATDNESDPRQRNQPPWGAIELQTSNQDNAEGNVFSEIAMSANGAFKIFVATATQANLILFPKANHGKRESDKYCG